MLLFLVFGGLMAAVVAVAMAMAYRFRPLFRPGIAGSSVNLDRYREVVDPLRTWLLIGVRARPRPLRRRLRRRASGAATCCGGTASSSARPTPTSTRTSASTSSTCRGCTTWSTSRWPLAVLGLLAAAVVHYLFGGIRLQSAQRTGSPAPRRSQISALLALFVLLKGADYWLDRFDLTTDSRRPVHRHELHRPERRAARQGRS